MRKKINFLLFLLLFTTLKIVAQNNIEIRVSSFGDGNTASIADILSYPSITLINKDAKGDAKLISYNCNFSGLDKKRNPNKVTDIKNQEFRFNDEAISLLRKFLPGDNFEIKNIQVEVTNEKTKTKEIKEIASISIKIGEKSILFSNNTSVDYSGKLLTGKDHNLPVTNQKVVLQDHVEKELQSTLTDNSGDFYFKNLDVNESYKINVTVDDKSKIKDDKLYTASLDGTITKSFNKTKKGFVYELLPNELNTLTKIKEEDTELTIRNFGSSKQSELTVVEYIYYDPNSAEIKTESIRKLDKIITAMDQNLTLKLLITSHTDSKGEDAYNMTLSEKRAQKVMGYFIIQGIEKGRISAKGLGETQIMNRCKNGVECSEAEHQQNRRTEFKFTK